ncbi:MAG TPA: septum formation protein Maf [Bacteroidales bacterium]|nr:septum formation protein Maf [Bacteroidales bacterium]
MNIILGSSSPRRRELLAMLGVTFDVCSIDADESYPANLMAAEIPCYISQQKAKAFGIVEPDTLLITADTIVWLDGIVYGKPANEQDAENILAKLSARTHQVITGVTIRTAQLSHTFAATTDVHFAPLTTQQIHYYVTHYHPLDKAGAYGIQEWIGAVGIKGITGSYYNVMGLPVHQLYKELKALDIVL